MLIRTLMVLGLVGSLLAFSGTAEAAKGKKGKKKEHMVHGVIESIDGNTMVVKIHHHKKKKGATPSTPTAPTEKKVKFNQETKVEIGHKGDFKAGSLSDLKKGEHVRILEKGDRAEKVVIHQGKKGKKKKKAV